MPWLFLLAYTCSGLAGLIYEVSWTRLLTLYIGHTTAAASAVVAAFLGGLSVGAAAGGTVASHLSARRSLQAYAALEAVVAIAALLVPFELRAFQPLLEWAYNSDGAGFTFAAIRLVLCLAMVFVPAAALGATFPMAVRWYASASEDPARSSGVLYFLNTVGAAAGAVLAGFILIPAIGLSGATLVAVAASSIAAAAALLVAIKGDPPSPSMIEKRNAVPKRRTRVPKPVAEPSPQPWLAASVLGLSGFAALVHEITWTRILALLLGPTVYAFAATLAAVIAGVAIGSGIGTAVLRRVRRPAAWLVATLTAAAITTGVTYSLAGRVIPRALAQQMASATDVYDPVLRQGLAVTSILILPTAVFLGAAFPLALALARSRSVEDAARRFGTIYAVNTIGAVTGSLAAGFLLIPGLGLQNTLRLVSVLLVVAAAAVLIRGLLSRRSQISGLIAAAAAVATLFVSPSWDRDLMASGAYLYAPYVPKDLDLESLLKAGSLLYYREGASATVSVKRLTGTTTLAVDGKTDASNRGDMLTQKLVAHLPLLLHDNPRDVGIIGLGSGVTVGAALSHPIARADVVEISPEVVEASNFFLAENHRALADPRTHLIVGDGRSHLLLGQNRYDVLISEPSNPWIAGVAALFTREFFVAARERLAPGGIICQWANAYNISDPDLRSIVATFTSVFPNGMAWLVGADDVVLVASVDALDDKLPNIARHWKRPGVSEDLAQVAVSEPFALLSLFVAGPQELQTYSAGAPLLTDDTMRLEFSGPRDLRSRREGENGAELSSLLKDNEAPLVIRTTRASRVASEWRKRGDMLAKRDAYTHAYEDYVKALTLDHNDTAALDALVRTAILINRASDALSWIKALDVAATLPVQRLVATSKLLAASGAANDALTAARDAAQITPPQPEALEQLASLLADTGDTDALDEVVRRMRVAAPQRPATEYYAAVSALLRGRAEEAAATAERVVSTDRSYAPVYDLLGAAYTKLSQPEKARKAFETSLQFDAHDSTAYTNLGLLDLAEGNHDGAARYFAEALWLAPNSATAREGLARSKLRP